MVREDKMKEEVEHQIEAKTRTEERLKEERH
jgi:hypothetical protein